MGNVGTVSGGCFVSAPGAPDFADGVARRRWEISLPALWKAYYAACGGSVGDGMGGICGSTYIADAQGCIDEQFRWRTHCGRCRDGSGVVLSGIDGVGVGRGDEERGRLEGHDGDTRGGSTVCDGESGLGVTDGEVDGSSVRPGVVDDTAAVCGTMAEPHVAVKLGPNGGVSQGRGRNYVRNQVARELARKRKNEKKNGRLSQDWRSPASLESSGESLGSQSVAGKCWTVKEESPMEQRIREAEKKKKSG